MSNKLLALYGLKWNPFAPEVPTEALWKTSEVEHFCWRIETLAREGGFALITGEPGSGKSVTLRLLAQRLDALRDLKVGVLTRPHSSLTDFYREMGDLFGLPLSPHNRWAGTRVLRECWQSHIKTAPAPSAHQRVFRVLQEANRPLTVAQIRTATLCDFLAEMHEKGSARKTPAGYQLIRS